MAAPGRRSGRDALEVVDPLRLAGAARRPGARDDELAHDGGARAAVVAVEAHHDAVVLASADVVGRLGDVEERVVNLEDVLRGVGENVSERDRDCSPRFHSEWTLHTETFNRSWDIKH